MLRGILFLSFGLIASFPHKLRAAPTYSLDPVGPLYEGVTTDLFDIASGNRVIFSTAQHQGAGVSDPRSLFGYTSGFIENTHTIFADGISPGYVEFIEWQTPSWINLSSFELRLSDDGSTLRSVLDYKLFGSKDGLNFSQLSTGVLPRNASNGYSPTQMIISDTALTGIATGLRSFRIELTRADTTGARLIELDGFGSLGAQTTPYLDRIAFNAASNSLTGRSGYQFDDEGPGLGNPASIVISSRLFSTDTPEDVFGNNNGPIEDSTFLFEGGGTVDNGDSIFGNFGETVDFLEWHTNQPLTLAGFQIGLAGEGIENGNNRGAELVRFLVEGMEVGIFDANGVNDAVTHYFNGGSVTGDDFRVEFTRSSTSGVRVKEIDAILAVPEPTALTSFVIGAVLLTIRRRRFV